VILADTSAWVEYLRGTESATHHRLRDLVAGRRAVAMTGPVAMEVLAGADDASGRAHVRRLIYALDVLPVESPADWEAAAEIYAACRRAGETVRSHLDCLIAAVAIREDAAVLHRGRDFDVIARHAPLRIDAP
jgi:predicted nucleic acid-binding protein